MAGSDVKEITDRLKATKLSVEEKARTGLVYGEGMLQHESPWGNHVENPRRLTSILEHLKHVGLWDRCRHLSARKATKEELELVHSPEWISEVERTASMSTQSLKEFSQRFDSVYACNGTNEAACTAAGSGLELVTKIMVDELENGMALIRPPGHHAGKKGTSGYCVFNNVALAAKHAVQKLNAQRVLIVDWDVHHGQGTQDLFYDDKRVLYVSVHRYEQGGYWPHLRRSGLDHTGQGEGAGYNVNIPLNQPGLGDADYLAVWLRLVLPIAFQFNPDLVLVSAGFDACAGDPKGGMKVSPQMFAHLTHLLKSLAKGKIAMFLEGGYNWSALGMCAESCLSVLLGDPTPILTRLGSPHQSTIESILNVMNVLREQWRFLRLVPISNQEFPSRKKHVTGSPFDPPRVVVEEKLLTLDMDGIPPPVSTRAPSIIKDTSLVYDPKMMGHHCSSIHIECPQRIEKGPIFNYVNRNVPAVECERD